jgi:rod shape-determining protein MreD.
MLRLKYYFEWFFYFLFFSLVAIVQATFISALPAAYFAINLPLTALLFSLLFFNRNMSLVIAILMGFWLDILGFNFFGLHILVFLAVVFIIDFMLNNWLTNRSLYSFLVLSILGALIHDILLYGMVALWQSGQAGFSFFLFQAYFWKQMLWQMFWNAIFMILFFSLANSLSKHLKPFFLEKN